MPDESPQRLSRAKGAVLFAAACLLAGAVAAIFIYERHPALPELNRSELTPRDGIWYRANDGTVFTGTMLDRYETGLPKARSEIANGLLEGVSRGWYTNGQPQIEEHFRAGVSHGLRTKWHANGHKLSEVNIINGKLEGTFRRWDEAGTLSEETEMKDGNPDGLSRGYYPSGYIKAEVRLERGNVVSQQFWKDGEQKSSSFLRANAPRLGR